jgi:cell wall-associated NlpC family hydrolase
MFTWATSGDREYGIYRKADFMRREILIKLIRSLVVLCLLAPQAMGALRIADLDRFPQSASSYLPADPDVQIVDDTDQMSYSEEYLASHIAPWHNDDLSYLSLSMDRVIGFYEAVAKKNLYTADAKPYPAASMKKIAANAKVDPNATPRPGVALADADVRILATSTPLFTSKASAKGERGLLKLDAIQNSVLKPGEPLAVFGASADSAWCFIATGTVVGWVRSHKVAVVGREFMERWELSPHSVAVKDNIAVNDSQGKLLYTIKLGTILPRDEGGILVPEKGSDGRVLAKRITLEEGASAPFPVPFTPRNAAAAIDQMMGESYGWGGANGLRDCSAMTRDYFSVFGVWLPRNSGDQAKTGDCVKLNGIRAGERLRVIAQKAVPYATLVHMPGHIMLYIGVYDSKPVVFHNVWGVRINSSGKLTGRAVIGRAVASSLEVGAEIKNRPKASLILDRTDAMTFPTIPAQLAEEAQ